MRKALRSLSGVFFCVAIFIQPGFASDAAKGPAEVQIRAALIEWPLLQHAATLSVQSPNGQVRTMSFDAGQTPRLRLTDVGNVDGSFTWELRKALAEEDDLAHAEAFVQSGSFAVSNGSFLTPRDVEAETVRPGRPATNDQLIPDDLIVQGSLCVGIDCNNNESFGFNTIVLKENNLRIAVEDTSTYPYPSTDWTIAFNDSASGGANQMIIADSTARTTPFGIEGGARSYALWVDAIGYIGLGTSMPQENLHFVTPDTPTVRFEQTAGVFPAYTWDIGANEAHLFIRDGNRFPLRIRPGAPTSAIDVRADGNVGLNCASANSDLVIASGDGCADPSSSLNAGDAQFTVASSRTFKENLAPVVVPDVLEKLLKIDVYRYDYIDGPKDRLGLMAEDFHEIFARGSEKYIDGNEVQMALWLAVRKLTADKMELMARIEALEAKLANR